MAVNYFLSFDYPSEENKMNRFQRLLGVVASSLVALGAAAPACAQTRVSVGLNTPPGLIFAVEYLAVGQGFFKQEGLDVELVAFDGSGVVIPQIAQQRVLIGRGNADVVILSRQAGRSPLPLRCFYNVVRRSAFEFIVPEASPIRAIGDIKGGKKVGVISLAAGNLPATRALLAEAGLKQGTDFEFVAVGTGAIAVRTFATGQIDVLNLWDAEHVGVELAGNRIRQIPQPAKFSDQVSSCWMAHEDVIRDKTDVLARFGRAFAKASYACQANWPFCVKNFYAMNLGARPTAGTEAEQIEKGVKIMRSRVDKFFHTPPGVPLRMGEFQESSIRDSLDILAAGGQIASKDIPMGVIFTNELVGEINKFDIKSVTDTAKAWK